MTIQNMEDFVFQLPAVLKNIVSEYTFHTIHREQISETLRNIRIRGDIEYIRIYGRASKEDDEEYIKLCNTCTCCPRHSKKRPESLYPSDHKSYVMTMYKGLELSQREKHHVCSCRCRHISRSIVRKHDPFRYNEYFQCRAFFIYNYIHITHRVTELREIFQNISSYQGSPPERQCLYFIYLLRSLNRNKTKLKTKLIKLHSALRNITPHSISPLIDNDETPNLHHKYIHLWDDIHELLYDIKTYIKTETANDTMREAARELHQLCIS